MRTPAAIRSILASDGFRRVKGYADMPTLVSALRARDRQLDLVNAEGDRHVA
jgi:hypothetical protein